MSITVRLWSKKDLEDIDKCSASGKMTLAGRRLVTTFLNKTALSADEIKHYPYNLRKQYSAEFGVNEPFGSEINSFYATDDETALWFLKQEYDEKPDFLTEIITTTRDVIVP